MPNKQATRIRVSASRSPASPARATDRRKPQNFQSRPPQGLDDRVDLVVARTGPDPALLKPSPHLIEKAIAELAAAPAESALVGDSITDIYAAQLAGIATIGYANKPGKHDSFAAAGAAATITSLADLGLPLRAKQYGGQ